MGQQSSVFSTILTDETRKAQAQIQEKAKEARGVLEGLGTESHTIRRLGEPAANSLWRRIDVNGDNILSESEAENLYKLILLALIGDLQQNEKKEFKAMWEELDRNGNGRVTKNEFIRSLQEGVPLNRSQREIQKLRARNEALRASNEALEADNRAVNEKRSRLEKQAKANGDVRGAAMLVPFLILLVVLGKVGMINDGVFSWGSLIMLFVAIGWVKLGLMEDLWKYGGLQS